MSPGSQSLKGKCTEYSIPINKLRTGRRMYMYSYHTDQSTPNSLITTMFEQTINIHVFINYKKEAVLSSLSQWSGKLLNVELLLIIGTFRRPVIASFKRAI